jgi:hypothetical protein
MRPNTEARNVLVTFYYFIVTCDLRGNDRDITIVGKTSKYRPCRSQKDGKELEITSTPYEYYSTEYFL